ncbi:nucleotide exchange factor GrpE [Desulforhopalus sp. 52FAK]
MVDEFTEINQDNSQDMDEAAVWKKKYLYMLADLENTQKRLIRSSAQEVDQQKKELLRDVLPIADGIDMALMHLTHQEDCKNILDGVELIRNLINKFLTKYDVQEIDAWGKPFDPTLQEAIGMIQHPEIPANTVARVEQKGYLYRNELLRSARVLVVSGK